MLFFISTVKFSASARSGGLQQITNTLLTALDVPNLYIYIYMRVRMHTHKHITLEVLQSSPQDTMPTPHKSSLSQ